MLLALADALNATGRYPALYVTIESAQPYRDDFERAGHAIAVLIANRAETYLKDARPHEILAKRPDSGGAVQSLLAAWSAHSPLPLVILFDETNALAGDSWISLLRQLRAGYSDRPANFPQSIVLCGARDLQDYRIHEAKEVITGGSAFTSRQNRFVSSTSPKPASGRETGQAFDGAAKLNSIN